MSLGQVTSSAGGVNLQSAEQILNGSTSAGVINVAAPVGGAVLIAESGIGSASAPLISQLANLEADAGSGGLFVDNSGNLRSAKSDPNPGLEGASIQLTTSGTLDVKEPVSASGPATLTSSGALTVHPLAGVNAGGPVALNSSSLTVQENANVSSFGDSVFITTSGDVDLQSDSLTSASPGGGRVVIDASTSTNPIHQCRWPAFRRGRRDPRSTGAEDIHLRRLSAGVPYSVNGGGGVVIDTLNVHGTDGNDLFDVTENVVTAVGITPVTYADIWILNVNVNDASDVNARLGSDAFVVTGTSAIVGTTLFADKSDAASLDLSTNGQLNERLNFIGNRENHPIHITADALSPTVSADNLLDSGAGTVNGLGLDFGFSGASSLDIDLDSPGRTSSIRCDPSNRDPRQFDESGGRLVECARHCPGRLRHRCSRFWQQPDH